MATIALRIVRKDVTSKLKVNLEQVRHGHHIRGKPPMIARTLKQRLELLNETDPVLSAKVNIGFSVPKISPLKKQEWTSERKKRRSDVDFERRVRNGQLSIDLEEARRVWLETSSPFEIHKIAEHYGIFQHLFGDAFFFPVVPLSISYEIDNDIFVRVHSGNVIKPAEACKLPNIDYKVKENTLWTLVMSTPDGNLENPNDEYCHLFLGNIPGNKVNQGERIMDYFKPIPARGAGYYRYVFILYKQNQPLDYGEYKKTEPCLQLNERNWNTLEFYRKYQDHLTPAGLSFFQSDWDFTVKEFFHTELDSAEPVFQYEFPKPYVRPQEWFPLKHPFNIYMDRYKDPRDVMKQFLLRKLQTVHPFAQPKPPLKYPNARPINGQLASWLKLAIQHERLGWGRVNELK
ncbi:39S ribosomal protein L38, mitochondrial [Ceratina calcarata]|uniref:Large ribosomal subunit protein mL38 n=1 Tax=Ceratina calcarata TaxID=156304 RepID=A0AAJ7JHC9_9HYME|nr:39S ribosomal protein L38, mitochondrial [Ceratina calcarata]XP_017893248.1 39S ribosomal protein L38, mitochondrial [Ceratina calcarata]XP_026666910.1 39S ribosomal protein L38, mitochondrial [Ceratina calcarata]